MFSNQLYIDYYNELNKLLEEYNVVDTLKTTIIDSIKSGIPDKEFDKTNSPHKLKSLSIIVKQSPQIMDFFPKTG